LYAQGFFYAHLGWMIMKPNDENYGIADVSDLKKNKIIAWQVRSRPSARKQAPSRTVRWPDAHPCGHSTATIPSSWLWCRSRCPR
jgi:hypothetical protein